MSLVEEMSTVPYYSEIIVITGSHWVSIWQG